MSAELTHLWVFKKSQTNLIIFSWHWLCVCVCACVWVCVSLCVCMGVGCVFLWCVCIGQKVSVLKHFSLTCILRWGFTETGVNALIRLASFLQWSTSLHLPHHPVLRWQIWASGPSSHMDAKDPLGFSCSYGKHFTNGIIFPSPSTDILCLIMLNE